MLKKIILFIFPVIKILGITFPCLILLLYIIKHDSRKFNKEVLIYLIVFEVFALVAYIILRKKGWIGKEK